MTEEILALCGAMGAGESQQALLQPIIQAVQAGLEQRLKENTSPEDCGTAFPLAAAMLAMDALNKAAGSGGVESFTAGAVSIRTRVGGEDLSALAERLLAPWLGETGFAFRGVAG